MMTRMKNGRRKHGHPAKPNWESKLVGFNEYLVKVLAGVN